MKKFVLFTGILLGLFLTSCDAPEENTTQSGDPRVVNVNTKEASQILRDNKGNSNFMVIDLRTPEEFAQGHIKGATLINFTAPNFDREVQKLDPKKSYLVYCASGGRRSRALNTVRSLSLTRIYHLQRGLRGGIPGGLDVPVQGTNPYKIKIGM